MNYYEELGVAQDAAPEEIRQAYKTLVRLLHPDGQSDERLKMAAERQMRRLNEAVAILIDPLKRRSYDDSLGHAAPVVWPCSPPAVPAWQMFAVRNWFWILLSGMVGGSAVWYVAERDPAPVVAPAPEAKKEPARPAPSAVSGDPETALPPEKERRSASRRPWRGVELPADGFRAEAGREGADRAAVVPLLEPPPPLREGTAEAPGVPEILRSLASSPPLKSRRARSSLFAGNWLSSGDDDADADANSYRAFYIELSLVEENGRLTGNYRARYRIPDKAISPEVALHMEGEAGAGKSGRLTWASEEGAKGVAELTLKSGDTLYMTWWTTAFGRRAALASGTAKLTRQQVR
jgi:curved DNA-binding protein CbpA